jgi:hypothetical protein
MSAIVTSIFNAITSTVTTALGPDYKQLRNIFKPEDNDLRIINKAYAVRHGASTNADGITRHYTMDQRFEVVLVNRASQRDDDAATQAIFGVLYDKADDILRAAFSTKLGIPSIVLNVDSPEISQPELLENDAAVIVLSFNVKYRQAVI